MSTLLQRLSRDHHRLIRVMDLLESQLARFNSGNQPSYDLLCELLEYIVDYTDQVHHPSEDQLFARVQAVSDVHHPLLQHLIEEHVILAQLGRQLRTSLEGIIHEAVVPREQVSQQGAQWIQMMRAHLDREEAEAFVLARQWLTAADWEALDQQTPTAQDPVFGQLDPLRFRTLYAHLKDEQELSATAEPQP